MKRTEQKFERPANCGKQFRYSLFHKSKDIDGKESLTPIPILNAINIRKTGRNEKCPCGSGRKFKQCCLD